MQAQARICPVCYDDHSAIYACENDNLLEAIATRDAEIERLNAAFDRLQRASEVVVAEDAARISNLTAETERLRRDKSMALRLARTRGERLDAIRDCIKQNKSDDLVRVEVEWLIECHYKELDAAMESENG